MPQNITITPGWDSPLTAAADGDAVNGANDLTKLQKIANRLGQIGGYVPGIDKTVDTYQIPMVIVGAADRFTALIATERTQDSVNTGSSSDKGEIWIPINWPFQGGAAQITELRVYVKGGAGHGGLPAGMPAVELYDRNLSDGSQSQIGSTALDPSGSVGAYEAAHNFAVTGLTQALSDQHQFYARVRGEAGTNALVGLKVYGLRVSIQGL